MKEQKGLKFALLFFIILTLGLGGYVIYDKVLQPIKDSTGEKLDNQEKPDEPEKPEPEKRVYTEYLILHSSEKPDYLVGVSNNKYYEIHRFNGDEYDDSIQPIGLHLNKLYFANSYGVSYIDLKEDELKEETWFKYPIDSDGVIVSVTGRPVFIGDDMIFHLSSSGSEDNLGGILSLDLDAKSLDEVKQLVKEADFVSWAIDDQKENIYYVESGRGLQYSLAVYNFKTDSTKKLAESVDNEINYSNGYLLYNVRGFRTSQCDDYSVQIYLYNTRTKTNKLINKNVCTQTRKEVLDNQIWYDDAEGNSHLYNINTEMDTVFAKKDVVSLRNGKLYVSDGSSTIENDLIVNKAYEEKNVEVIMADNTTKQFSEETFDLAD